jgi:hypothetical protein
VGYDGPTESCWYRDFRTHRAFWSCFSPGASARLVEELSYERLLKEADLVVIAIAISSKGSSDSFVDERWQYEFVGQNTKFRVLQVLKGPKDLKSMVVLHYKFGKIHDKAKKKMKKGDLNELIDAPSFVSFFTSPTEVEIAGWLDPKFRFQYLLYLKKRADGRFEPVSGQIDPNLAIRELFPPLFSEGKATKQMLAK